jgi:hypothetical protein
MLREPPDKGQTEMGAGLRRVMRLLIRKHTHPHLPHFSLVCPFRNLRTETWLLSLCKDREYFAGAERLGQPQQGVIPLHNSEREPLGKVRRASVSDGAPRATSGQDLGDGVWPILAALLPRTAALRVAAPPRPRFLRARAHVPARSAARPGRPGSAATDA